VSASLQLLHDPERVRLALSPLRRDLLERLREPSSATQLARELDTGRQRINYHLRVLEAAGLVELVEERPRRGFVERILVASANAFLVDPAVVGAADRPSPATAQDRFASEHLMGAAAEMVRELGRQRSEAERGGTRLLTFTLETEVGFAAPIDLEAFTEDLTQAMATLATKHNASRGGRRYRVMVGGHPAPSNGNPEPQETQPK
jgi:DNA-binding transcriptional ArsR family regulator